MQRKEKIILLCLFLASFILRFWPIRQELFFGPEQGRDALVIQEMILKHKFTLLGPKTDIDGIFHGPLYYYLLLIPYALLSADPVAASAFFIGISCLSVFLIYWIGRELFSQNVAILSAFLFTISPRAIEYARWLSNATLVPLFSLLFFVALIQIARKKSSFLFLLALSAGFLIQLQLLNGLFVLSITLISFLFLKPRFSPKIILASVSIFILSIASFIIFDLRHQFLMLKTASKVFSQQIGFAATLGSSIIETHTRLNEEIIRYVLPAFPTLAGFIFIFGLILVLSPTKSDKRYPSILLYWIGLPILILAFSRHSVLNHFFLFISSGLFFFPAIALVHLKSYGKFLPPIFLTLITVFNIQTFSTIKPWGTTIWQEKKAIDYIYQTARGETFRFEAFTIPYFWPDAWTYMFSWYGKKSFGYLPIEENPRYVYFIWEEEASQFQKDWLGGHVAQYKRTDAQNQFGNIHVERRVRM